jgi:hypothetical protein
MGDESDTKTFDVAGIMDLKQKDNFGAGNTEVLNHRQSIRVLAEREDWTWEDGV